MKGVELLEEQSCEAGWQPGSQGFGHFCSGHLWIVLLVLSFNIEGLRVLNVTHLQRRGSRTGEKSPHRSAWV